MSLIYCHKCYGATQCVCETPADKSPPREFWIYQDKIDHDDIVSSIEPQYEKDIYTHVIEHSAYLAVKQELDATKYDHNQMRGVLDNMKQELEAARAENYQERCKTQTKINLIEQMQFEEKNLLKQLADVREELENAKAQIKDYESALSESWPGEFGAVVNARHRETLNKWRAK